MSEEQDLARGLAESLEESWRHEHARAAERVLMDERRGDYLANMLVSYPTEPPGEVASPPVVRSIAHDGSCVPRAVLVALGQSARDADVAKLRATVVTAMAANPGRYLSLVLEGAEGKMGLSAGGPASGGASGGPGMSFVSSDGSLAASGLQRFEHHLSLMSAPGCFFEDPEFLCLADLFGVPVAVDAVVVKTGDTKRTLFDPILRGPRSTVTLLFLVCVAGASHCEPVNFAPAGSHEPPLSQEAPPPPAPAPTLADRYYTLGHCYQLGHCKCAILGTF